MTRANSKEPSPTPSPMRLVVEVDGNPIGFLSLDVDRLWPLIHHRKRDVASAEWMDTSKFDSMMRAVVMKRLISRIEGRLYQSLGDEMVKAELEIENLKLKADVAVQAFGQSQSEIEKVVTESGKTSSDFYKFFWEYLLDERDVTDLKKAWKSWDTAPR
jgi:hypothetical protein